MLQGLVEELELEPEPEVHLKEVQEKAILEAEAEGASTSLLGTPTC